MPKRKATDRVMVPVRMPEMTRSNLQKAAKHAGRSMNAEIVDRLDNSFRREDAFGGAAARPIAMHLVNAFRLGGETRARDREVTDWTSDAECYLNGVSAAMDALLAALPAGTTDEDAALTIEDLKGRLLSRIAQRKERADGR